MARGIGTLVGLGLALGLASAALAAPLTPKQAKKVLFKGAKISVQVFEDAPVEATTLAQVNAVAKAIRSPQVAAQFAAQGYYGAIAVMPDRPISEKSMTISAGLHSPARAQQVAVDECNRLDGPDCVAVALILPKRFKPQDLTLNQAASTQFRSTWTQGNGPKYLAYSPATNAWVIAGGTGADAVALERCNAKAAEVGGASDCVIAIADE